MRINKAAQRWHAWFHGGIDNVHEIMAVWIKQDLARAGSGFIRISQAEAAAAATTTTTIAPTKKQKKEEQSEAGEKDKY
jgi:hypothetical protein